MKNILLYTLAITLLGMVGVSAAASGPVGWSQKFKCENSCPRFQVLKTWDNAAVLDKETGLVWEQSPDTQQVSWADAHKHCIQLDISNRGGWRLPTVQELRGLVDKSQNTLLLPSGHPFSNVIDAPYWSATTIVDFPAYAWSVTFSVGTAGQPLKIANLYTWCVRGGSGDETQ